jgi:hypothetical protein
VLPRALPGSFSMTEIKPRTDGAELSSHECMNTIRTNIATHGQHRTLVQGGEVSRFAYTIGLLQSVGFELLVAGAAPLDAAEVAQGLNGMAAVCKNKAVDPS